MGRAVDVDEMDYFDACASSIGWCATCKEFTRDCTELDAEAYDCPQCEGDTVCGAEQALLLGLIAVL